MNPLQLFYQNETQREAVRVFMIDVLREMAADQAFNGESTTGIKEANECVEKTFDKLQALYNPEIPKGIPNSK